MKKKKWSLGSWGENKASEYLLQHSFIVLERNVRFSIGEIDIIAEKNNCLYFIEVKTRRSLQFGEGFESVSSRKIQKIQKAAETYIQIKKLDKDVQIAVLSIFSSAGKIYFDFLEVEKA